MAPSTVFKNARLIDGLGDQLCSNVSLVVTGDRIAAIEAGGVPAPPEALVVDLQGKTVVPGLIDTHVHSTFVGTPSLPLFLAAGVTSARDVGGNLEKVKGLKADLNSGKKLGPRLFICGPLLDGSVKSFEYPSFAEMLNNIPSPEVVPQKIGALLNAGVDAVKLYFTLMPDTVKAIIKFVDNRVPVTGHLGYMHSLDAIKAGINGLEHVWISPYNEFCALDMQFGVGASMMSGKFWNQTLKGWEEADLQNPRAREWFDAMVKQQVNMGTTLDLLWIARCGEEGVKRDHDRCYIPQHALSRQRALASRIGERPD